MIKDYTISSKEQYERFRNVYTIIKAYYEDLDKLCALLGKLHNLDIENINTEDLPEMSYLALQNLLNVFDGDTFCLENLKEYEEQTERIYSSELLIRDEIEYWLEYYADDEYDENNIKDKINKAIEDGSYYEKLDEIASNTRMSDYWYQELSECATDNICEYFGTEESKDGEGEN